MSSGFVKTSGARGLTDNISVHQNSCFDVCVHVSGLHEWLSGGNRTRCAQRFPNSVQEICKSCANYCCLFPLSPPYSSLKLVFWGNHSQMENIRCNHFHLPTLLLSLRGDMLSPSDISSQWTITEHSSITFSQECWHPKSGRNHHIGLPRDFNKSAYVYDHFTFSSPCECPYLLLSECHFKPVKCTQCSVQLLQALYMQHNYIRGEFIWIYYWIRILCQEIASAFRVCVRVCVHCTDRKFLCRHMEKLKARDRCRIFLYLQPTFFIHLHTVHVKFSSAINFSSSFFSPLAQPPSSLLSDRPSPPPIPLSFQPPPLFPLSFTLWDRQ